MLLPGTQMHITTFIFVSIELVIFFYLIIYKLSRPDDKSASLNIILIALLIIYNVSGGLFPDPNLPGSVFIQEIIAYGTGFITPCFFPYYVYEAFGLEKMKFHVFKGVALYLMLPYLFFVVVYAATNNLDTAKNLLIVPVVYALWIIYSLTKAIKYKYGNILENNESKEEAAVLFFSITPWIGLPVVAYFDLGQDAEALITNPGFLLLLALQVNRHIKQFRTEHQRLIDSEIRLLNWNVNLQNEVEKRTRELEKANEEKTTAFVNLIHETKTPLTLVSNYLEEYINKFGSGEELDIIKGGIDKITKDVTSLFDIERFKKGIDVYNHNQISNFSEILKDCLILFKYHCEKQNIGCRQEIEENILLKAAPSAIYRIVNNLVENALKFTDAGGNIEIRLRTIDEKICFSVKDTGIGIPPQLRHKIFEPYYQINHKKNGLQGMGLGLPIVKKVIDSLGGQIKIDKNPDHLSGTTIRITLDRHRIEENEALLANSIEGHSFNYNIDHFNISDVPYLPNRPTILIVEDNRAMLNFLSKRLRNKHNVFCALDGIEALKKLRGLPTVPDLILSDIIMHKMNGFAFAKAIADQEAYNHIPIIFLSARSTLTDKLKGLRAGAIDLIQKPFSFEIVSQKIDTILGNIKKQKKAILNLSVSNLKTLDNSAPAHTDIDSMAFDQTCKLYHLTPREIEIVKLIIKGSTYKMIGENMFISEKTVAKHAENIFRKIGASNKIELINILRA